MSLDLTNLTITQVFSLAIVLAVLDTLAAMVFAATQQKFSLGAVAVWLQSHVLKRLFPILALAVIGNGIPAIDLPAIPFAFGLAIAGLTAYAVETIASIRDSAQDASRPADTSPQAN